MTQSASGRYQMEHQRNQKVRVVDVVAVINGLGRQRSDLGKPYTQSGLFTDTNAVRMAIFGCLPVGS